jgi:hypothetical protein
MRTLAWLAVAGHVLGTLLTIAAPNFAVMSRREFYAQLAAQGGGTVGPFLLLESA